MTLPYAAQHTSSAIVENGRVRYHAPTITPSRMGSPRGGFAASSILPYSFCISSSLRNGRACLSIRGIRFDQIAPAKKNTSQHSKTYKRESEYRLTNRASNSSPKFRHEQNNRHDSGHICMRRGSLGTDRGRYRGQSSAQALQNLSKDDLKVRTVRAARVQHHGDADEANEQACDEDVLDRGTRSQLGSSWVFLVSGGIGLTL